VCAEYLETPENCNLSLGPSLMHAGSKVSVLSVFNLSFWALNSVLEIVLTNRPQWPCGVRRGSPATRLLELWVRNPPGSCISICCACCVMSGRVLCVGLITYPEESFRMWRVWVWSWNFDTEESLSHYGLLLHERKKSFLTAPHYKIGGLLPKFCATLRNVRFQSLGLKIWSSK
jgi:hypothetical protein